MRREPEACSIIVLEEKDASAVAALEAACFSSSWSVEQYATVLRSMDAGRRTGADANRQPFLILGLRGDSGLLGYISLGVQHAAAEAEIYNIAVAGEQRNRGLGRRLLLAALERMAGAGIARVFLEVRTGNAPALALYAACGFTECGRRKGYYPDTGEDALVLCRDLP